MKKRLWSDEARALWHEGYTIFDVINYSTNHECAVSRYDTDHFFHKHKDTRWDHITSRLVTLVYYVHKVPASFTGGSLLV